MRCAKIVATLGPATNTPETLRALVDAGMDVARLNLSHGTHEVHAETYRMVREASDASGRGVGILVDLQGPKIRLGKFASGPVLLENGGSGGKSAGPIANQVIHALVAEGYLEGDPRMRSRPKVQPMGDPASDLAEAEG